MYTYRSLWYITAHTRVLFGWKSPRRFEDLRSFAYRLVFLECFSWGVWGIHSKKAKSLIHCRYECSALTADIWTRPSERDTERRGRIARARSSRGRGKTPTYLLRILLLLASAQNTQVDIYPEYMYQKLLAASTSTRENVEITRFKKKKEKMCVCVCVCVRVCV